MKCPDCGGRVLLRTEGYQDAWNTTVPGPDGEVTAGKTRVRVGPVDWSQSAVASVECELCDRYFGSLGEGRDIVLRPKRDEDIDEQEPRA